MNPERSERIEIPVLPLRDVVVYPHMVIPLFVGREKSIRCLEAAMDHDKKIMLVAQKEASTDEPGVNDLFTVGTVASILQMLKLPDGTVKVLVEGLQRARISALSDNGEHFSAKAEYLESPTIDEREQEVLVRTAISQFEGYIKLNKKIPPEVLTSLNSIDDPARLADTIAAHMPLKLADKQSVLEMSDVNERLEYLMAMMESEIDLLQVEKRIRNRVKKQMEKSQREYYLNEQMKAIQKELGEMVGFMGKTSDVRIAQYETEARTPKDDLIKQLADIFGVTTRAITVPNIDSYLGLMHTFFALEDEYGLQISTDKDGRPCITLDENHQAYDQIAPMLFAWLSQYSKLKQGEISEEEYDNWRYNYPNIEPTTGFVKNAISDDLDAELQDALSEEMKKRGLL